MQVLKARVQWHDGYCNDPGLELLVDKLPVRADLRWTVNQHEGQSFCWTVDGGYVSYFMHNPRDQEGYGGRTFEITTHAGNKLAFKGPWSSNAVYASRVIGEPIIHCALTDEPEAYERGYTFYAGDVTLALAQRAAELAGVELLEVARSAGDGVLSGEQCTVVEHGMKPASVEATYAPAIPGKTPKWVGDSWRFPERYRNLDKPDLNKPVFRIMPEAAEAVQKGKCPTCSKPVGDFRDDLSRREYGISGMCQACQDSVFEGGEHDDND